MQSALPTLLSLGAPVRRTIRVDGIASGGAAVLIGDEGGDEGGGESFEAAGAAGSAGAFFQGGRNEDALPDNFVRGWVASLIESTRARRTSGLFTPRGCEASVIANTRRTRRT